MELKTLDDYDDALKQAIKREEDAIAFYEQAAAAVHQADHKSLLKRLSIEEREHKKLLTDFAAGPFPSPGERFVPSRYTRQPADRADLTIEDIFQIALELEEETVDFYARLLVYFYKTGHEEVFKKIFDAEMKHKESLRNTYEAYMQKQP